ncbi:MAG: HEAT repeat domain-containing protein, partial [Myxococcota bacterium]|nr:HEAT repeat domain-containing protein [Myxococcota bacterium]
ARVYRQTRTWSEALSHFDDAIQRAGRDRDARQEILHEALETALEGGRMDKVQDYSAAYVATRPNHMPTRIDLGATLTRSGHHELALKAWKEAEGKARGQLRFLAAIWPEMARLHEQTGRLDEAELIWREALSRLPGAHWARPTALEGLIGVYRRRDALKTLLQEWKSQKKERFLETMAVARLHEELGEQKEALTSYRRAAELRRGDLESRKKVVELVRQTGSTKEVLKAYGELERVAPNEPSFPLSRAEMAFQRGKREQGTAILKRLLKRFSRDPGVHQRASDLLIRYGGDKAHRLIESCYTRLIRMEPREDAHVVSLGELFWSQGKQDKALTTWKRLLKRRGRSIGRAHLRLAEVLSEHRLTTQARTHYRMAVSSSPGDLRVLTAEARWLDEQGGRKEALKSWSHVLEVASSHGEGRLVAAEARAAVIRLWERHGRLDQEIKRLTAQTTARPDDLMSGLLLTEALLRQRRWQKAEDILLKIRQAAPERLDVLRALETLYTRSNRHKDALAVLDDIAEREDTYSPEILGRAARLALRTGDKERALRLALRLARESGGGAAARIEAGNLLTQLGRLEEAAEAWASALVITPRDGDLRFRLASLYQGLERPDDEEQLLTVLVEESLDPAHVLRAGKRLIQLALSRDRLEPLERILMPLAAYGGRRREVHLRLLVNVYRAMTQRLRWRPEASAPLRALGERALNPLLQALSIRDASLRGQALDVLELTQTPGAVPILSRLLSEADAGTRLRAASILGSLGTASSVNALTRFAKRNAASVRQMAIWALGLSRSEAAEEGLLQLKGLEPADRHVWVLALGMQTGVRSGATLRARLQQSVGSERLACIWALAHQARPESREALLSILDRRQNTATPSLSGRPRDSGTTSNWMHMAAWGVGRIGDNEARDALLARLWSPGPGHNRHRAVVIGLFTVAESSESPVDAHTLARYRSMMDPKSWKVTPNTAKLATLIPTRAEIPMDPDAQERRIREVRDTVDRLLEEGRPGRVARFLAGAVQDNSGFTLPELLPEQVAPAVSDRIREMLLPH